MTLSVDAVHVRLSGAEILHGVSLEVGVEPLAVVGRNGMGKTTLCRAIMGLVPISGGSVALEGRPLSGLDTARIARRGVAIVPQGRRLFPSLSVDEHLRLVGRNANAASGAPSPSPWTVDRVYATFPRLAERRRNGGAQLSGGEQQMLAIARALLLNPQVVVMDEPSEGLAPSLVDQLIVILRQLSLERIGLLLVEQNLRVATAVASTVTVMIGGAIAARVPSDALMRDGALQRRYLGVATASA